MFVEIQEKISAVFNISGFAIYIKISGIMIVKNYIHKRLNLRVMMNDEFVIGDEASMFSAYQAVNLGYHGQAHQQKEFANVTTIISNMHIVNRWRFW